MAGNFVWHELMAPDPAAAAAFYTEVVGWTAQDSGMPGMDYTLLRAGQTNVAGLMALTEAAKAAGAMPCWTGYVAVDDVDAKAAQAAALGGAVCMPPTDIPGVGRFAVVADPQGAVLAIIRLAGEQAMAAPTAPGSIGWNELIATDITAVWPFYAALFGWTAGLAIDMGPMGSYQLFAANGADCGGMMNRPAEVPHPYWCYYANVPDIDAATARATAAGATILMGPMEVPGGAWVINALDPQGAVFALVGQRASA